MTTDNMNFDLIDMNSAPPSLYDQGFGATEFDDMGGSPVAKVSIRVTGIQITDGSEVLTEAPAGSSIPLVVVGSSPIGYSYFENGYNKGDSAPPRCRSYDGLVPDPIIDQPMSHSCKTCPMRAKGSGKDGAGSVACKQRMNVAVISPAFPDKVLRLPLSPTAIFGNREVQMPQGYFPFKPLVASCREKKRQVMEFVLDVKHNPSAEQLQVIFKPVAWTQHTQGLMDAVLAHRHDQELLDRVYGKHEVGEATQSFEGLPPPDAPAQRPAPTAPTQQVTQAPPPRPPRGRQPDLGYTPYSPEEVEPTRDTYWQSVVNIKHDNGLDIPKVIIVPANTPLPNDDWIEVDQAVYVAYDGLLKEALQTKQNDTTGRTRPPRTTPKASQTATDNEEAGRVQGKGEQALTNSLDALLGDDDDE